jgi:hypothetical protein
VAAGGVYISGGLHTSYRPKYGSRYLKPDSRYGSGDDISHGRLRVSNTFSRLS